MKLQPTLPEQLSTGLHIFLKMHFTYDGVIRFSSLKEIWGGAMNQTVCICQLIYQACTKPQGMKNVISQSVLTLSQSYKYWFEG